MLNGTYERIKKNYDTLTLKHGADKNFPPRCINTKYVVYMIAIWHWLAGLFMTLTWVVHYYAIWWQITLNLDCTGARHWTVADRQAIRKTAATHWVVLQGDDGDDGVDGGDEDDDMIVEMMEFMAADHGITNAGATHCVVLLQMKKQWTLGRQCVGRCS